MLSVCPVEHVIDPYREQACLAQLPAGIERQRRKPGGRAKVLTVRNNAAGTDIDPILLGNKPQQAPIGHPTVVVLECKAPFDRRLLGECVTVSVVPAMHPSQGARRTPVRSESLGCIGFEAVECRVDVANICDGCRSDLPPAQQHVVIDLAVETGH